AVSQLHYFLLVSQGSAILLRLHLQAQYDTDQKQKGKNDPVHRCSFCSSIRSLSSIRLSCFSTSFAFCGSELSISALRSITLMRSSSARSSSLFRSVNCSASNLSNRARMPASGSASAVFLVSLAGLDLRCNARVNVTS